MQILYIHGLGGGGDSRIPAILSDWFKSHRPEVVVTVRTYAFDPETAKTQIASWVSELSPVLIVGESMGSTHALAVPGLPHILVSPALGTPLWFYRLAWLSLVPGAALILDRIYRPRPGDRQQIHFSFRSLRKWKTVYEDAMATARNDVRHGNVPFAFFGRRDHYLKWRIVDVRAWESSFGEDSFQQYDGTHFMEEEYIHTMLIPRICETLSHV